MERKDMFSLDEGVMEEGEGVLLKSSVVCVADLC